jgi:hypothetical protein
VLIGLEFRPIFEEKLLDTLPLSMAIVPLRLSVTRIEVPKQSVHLFVIQLLLAVVLIPLANFVAGIGVVYTRLPVAHNPAVDLEPRTLLQTNVLVGVGVDGRVSAGNERALEPSGLAPFVLQAGDALVA